MKIIRILEIAWLSIGIIALIIATYMLLNKYKDDAIYFFIFTLLAFGFYYVRRKQRLKMEKANENAE